MSESGDVELSDFENRPKVSWNNRSPSFGRSVKALFKRAWLLKIRHPAAVVEWVVACLIYIVICPIYILAQRDFEGSSQPEVRDCIIQGKPSSLTALIMGAAMYDDPKFILLPDTTRVHTILGGVFEPIMNALSAPPLSINLSVQYVNDRDGVEELVYASDATGVAIHWVNSESDDYLTKPEFVILQQSLMFDPTWELTNYLRSAVAATLAAQWTEQVTAGDGSVLSLLTNVGQILNSNITEQNYACVKTTQLMEIQTAVVFFAILPIVFAIMPDFQMIMEDKDSKVAAYSFLMGCSETAYWLVEFLMAFCLAVVPYILMTAMLCFIIAMVGTDFTLFLVINILFIISHIWFVFFLSTFMKKGSSGRAVTVIIIVLTMFFSMLHLYFTLSEETTNEAVKHIFSLLPLSAYELTLMTMYAECITSQPPIGWADIGRETVYPVWYGMWWMFFDAVAYFLLFLLFNTANGRQFGTPPLPWRDFFRKDGWRRLCKGEEGDEGRIGGDCDEFLNVSGLAKIYHGGKKDVTALNGLDFTIKTGEVIVVIGPNGSGKSTLINTIAGAIDPSDGKMSMLGGRMTNRFKEIQKYLGIVFQENVIIDLLSVREHMYLFGAFRGIPLDVLEESIEFYAHTLQLTHMLDNRAGDLSGGQKRKLCISLSLMGNPPIVVMDEPTAGVDVQARQLIWKTIASLEGTTSIVTSHALEEAEAVSSRLFILSNGAMPFCGTSTELRNEYKCGYLLKVEREGGEAGPVLDLAKSFIPSAYVTEERPDTIAMPVDDAIPAFLAALADQQEKLGIDSYSFAVEQLEDMLMKLIQTDEAAYGG